MLSAAVFFCRQLSSSVNSFLFLSAVFTYCRHLSSSVDSLLLLLANLFCLPSSFLCWQTYSTLISLLLLSTTFFFYQATFLCQQTSSYVSSLFLLSTGFPVHVSSTLLSCIPIYAVLPFGLLSSTLRPDCFFASALLGSRPSSNRTKGTAQVIRHCHEKKLLQRLM